jgi:hypothetical protein
MLASPAEKQRDDTSLIAAVVDLIDAGQRVLIDRIELALVETRAGARGALTSFALLLFGLALLLVGWVAANAVGVLYLEQYWARPQAIAAAALVNFVAGSVALLLARGSGKTIDDDSGSSGRTAAGGTIA